MWQAVVTSRPSIPLAPVTKTLMAARTPKSGSWNLDLRVVADDHPQGLGKPIPPRERDVAAQEAGLHPRAEVRDARAGEQDGMLHLGAGDADARIDRRV